MPLTGSYVGLGVDPNLLTATVTAPDLRSIDVAFDEAMAQATINAPGDWTLTPNGGSLARSIVTIDFGDDPSRCTVVVDGDLSSGAAAYTLDVAGTATDLAGNPISAVSADVDVPVVEDLEVDHCTSAIDRLAAQYRGKVNIEAILCIFGDRLNELERAALQVERYRSLTTAYGVGLDRIGEHLVEVRGGLSDAEYSVFLRAKGAAIAANGRASESLSVLDILINGTAMARRIADSYPAGFLAEAWPLDFARAERWGGLLQWMAPAAVKMNFLSSPDGDLFGWDEDETAFPFAEDDTATDGGLWSEAT